ncbi:MAG TPA: S8 family serine peptidase [Pyrinomonadaceae bacterium]|nr:S8 family serine peptidase [Pyrinomonadaceae bacterium]
MKSHQEEPPDKPRGPQSQDQSVVVEEVDNSARFRPLPPEKLFVRGLIEVQFEKDANSGVETWDFAHEKKRQELPEAWRLELREILQTHGLISWEPSFPLRYPWTPPQSDEFARKEYFKAGRDKFVTFNFPLEEDVLGIADKLRELPEIRKAVAIPEIAPPAAPLTEPFIGNSDQVVNSCDGCLTNQWYLFRCNVPGAWSQQVSGNGVVIADIDWGFNINHQDLRFRTDIDKNRNMFPDSGDPSIVSNGSLGHHGTAVLGLAGAGVNDCGITGIAFDATLWAIQAGTDTLTDHSLWVAAINFVHTSPETARKVIILEIQTAGCSNIEMIPTINMEIRAAIAANVVVCVPAGNGNLSGDAGLGDDGKSIDETGSILVGATSFDPQINRRSDSNGGDRVVVYAPGDTSHDLTCGFRMNGYLEGFGGTSGATAKVAGVAALMLEKNNQLTPLQIREILKHSSKYVVDGGMKQVGSLLDANRAVAEASAAHP